jgi:transcriptional regulator with XRE-family HTH domain
MAAETRLAYWLKRRGMTRAELHRRSEVPLSTLGRIERGNLKHPPNLRHLVDVAAALDVPLGELLEADWLRPNKGTSERTVRLVEVATADVPAWAEGKPRTSLERARRLVRWLNSEGFVQLTGSFEPEQAVIAQAEHLGLPVLPGRLAVGYPSNVSPVWLVFKDHQIGAPLIAVIARLGGGFQLLSPELLV